MKESLPMLRYDLKKTMLFALMFLLISSMSLWSVDSSFGLHMSGILDGQDGSVHLHPGLEIRNIGGRGVLGSQFSLDYLPENARDYHADQSGSVLEASAYVLGQLSFYYGDLAVYGGFGTSYYYIQDVGGFASIVEDDLLLAKLGFLYTMYPLQVFTEVGSAISFSSSSAGLKYPELLFGISLLR